MKKVSRVGRSYPKTGQGNQSQTQDSAATGRSYRGQVWVPRVVRDAQLDDTALALYVVLLSWANGDGTVYVGQARLMTALGREGGSVDSVNRATQKLVDAGIVAVARRHARALLRYTLLVRHQPQDRTERWDAVPRELLAALESRRAIPRDIRAWLHLDQRAGRRGFTCDTAETIAAGMGKSAATLNRSLKTFNELGLVRSTTTETGRMLTLTLHQITQPSTMLTASEVLTTTDESPIMVADAPRTDADSRMYLAPDNLTPDPAPSELRSDRPVSDARTPATSGLRPKKKFSRPTGGVHATPGVTQVLDELGPDWTTGPARRWRNGIGSAIAAQLAAGMTPGAAAGAIIDLGDGFLEDAGGRHVIAARQALKTRAAEIRWGLACAGCGRHEDHHDGIRIEHGQCTSCREACGVVDEIPAEVLAKVHAHFGFPASVSA